jgi:alkylhydroperoxidase/carboxymuconolactone decarboxylase family protein YurZ
VLSRRGPGRGRLALPAVANMGRLLQTHPRIGPAFNQLLRQIMAEPGVLSHAERQMVAAVAAAAQDCHY